MLLQTSFALAALVAQASALYFFPPAANGDGFQRPFTDGLPHQPTRVTPFPPPRAHKLVHPVIGNVSAERLRTDLETFTSFKTRHAPTKVYWVAVSCACRD
jgi:hypothetical protein